MKKTAFCLLLAVCIWSSSAGAPSAHGTTVYAASQQSPSTVPYTGQIVDARDNTPLIGATIILKGTTIGTSSDTEGNFRIEVPSTIRDVEFEVSYIGYRPETVRTVKTSQILIRLTEDATSLEEVQVIAYGQQKKVSVTGAIASVGTKDLLKSPSGSPANALAGAITGISTVQMSGQPGAEDPSIYVRGTGSLSSTASQPLILVDGVERSFFQIDPHEIESITVLKDASSTAVFGVRGANGVILVTTRRGDKGSPEISWNSSFGLTQSLRNLSGVGSYDYARIYSEIERSDTPGLTDDKLTFSPFVMERFRKGDDPIMFPDVDWNDYIFKNLAWQTQHSATISGGGNRVRYFVSGSFLEQDGMLKKMYESYDPNYNYQRFNYRSNIDIDLSRTTQLRLNVGGRTGTRREPVTDALWQKIMWATPFSSPGFVDGKYISNPHSSYIPLAELSSGLDFYYNWGYRKVRSNELNLDLALDQNLDAITKGLKINIKGAYNTTHSVTTQYGVTAADSYYSPYYLGSITQPGMDVSDPEFDNTIIYKTEGVTGLDEPMSYNESATSRARDWYLEASLNYQRSFGDHDVSALLLYNQSKSYYPAQYVDIPTAYVGYVGRLTYSYRKRYLIDFNIGYNGSENFAPGKRYGLFPAGSIGWILSEENFMKQQTVIDFLKLRASYGLVGNDKYSGARFLYRQGLWYGQHSIRSAGGSYEFGSTNNGMQYDAMEGTIGNDEVTWEKVRKQNYGIDLKMFNSRLSLTADYFFEHRYDILSSRNTLPSIVAVNLPLMNLGVVDNHGYEISLGWNDSGRNLNWWVQGNVSYSKNKIIYICLLYTSPSPRD